jgi:hypothetical protein
MLAWFGMRRQSISTVNYAQWAGKGGVKSTILLTSTIWFQTGAVGIAQIRLG